MRYPELEREPAVALSEPPPRSIEREYEKMGEHITTYWKSMCFKHKKWRKHVSLMFLQQAIHHARNLGLTSDEARELMDDFEAHAREKKN